MDSYEVSFIYNYGINSTIFRNKEKAEKYAEELRSLNNDSISAIKLRKIREF